MKNSTTAERKSEREVVVTRTFNGPARIVFEAWTKPELLMRWWMPKSLGISFVSCEIDARADLFSLGVMLFELATGLRPWPGDNPIAIAVAQATTSPRTIDTASGVPPYFAAIVSACLQLEATDRPASAAEVGAAFAEKRPPVTPRGSVTRIATAAAG